MLPGSPPLWIRFCKKRGEFNLFLIKTGIGRKNPLDRVTECNGRGDVVDRYPCPLDYRRSAEKPIVCRYLGASRIQTLQTFVHTRPERREIDSQKSVVDDLRGLLG